MAERGRAQPKGGRRRGTFALDVVLLAPSAASDDLNVLLGRAAEGEREKWRLPFEVPAPENPLRTAALLLAKTAAGAEPAWMEQIGAFGDGRRHPSHTDLSVAYVGVVPAPVASKLDVGIGSWVPAGKLPTLAPRQKEIVREALEVVRARLDHAPIAFRLLPPLFTLSELQQMYELLLGRPLHKASFRRALQAALLVEPIDEWRSEGRGRPAQLFRYSPRRRRRDRRGVRFELLGG